MSSTVVEALFIVVLILANAVFVMSETAIISARKSRLQQRANEGDPRAQTALELANAPNTFLAMTQVGITLVGVLAGAFGGATIADVLATEMRAIPWLAPHANGLSLAIVVFIITYLQLIIGELVPKQLALRSPEWIASLVAGPMRAVSRPAAFLIHLLGASTNLVLRLIGARTSDEPAVTEEEIKVMIDQGTQTGTFQRAERDMVGRVFRLGDLRIGALMTPRTEVT
jgi:putative hemolysin